MIEPEDLFLNLIRICGRLEIPSHTPGLLSQVYRAMLRALARLFGPDKRRPRETRGALLVPPRGARGGGANPADIARLALETRTCGRSKKEIDPSLAIARPKVRRTGRRTHPLVTAGMCFCSLHPVVACNSRH